MTQPVVTAAGMLVCCRMKADDAGVTFCDGTVLHSSQCEAGFGHDWMTAIIKLSNSLRRTPSADLSSVASLAALTLVTGTATSPSQRHAHQINS